MEKFIKLLSPNLECLDYKIIDKNHQCVIHAHSAITELVCPYCGTISSRVHSVYQREVQDLPLQGMKTILLIDTRRMLCENVNCSHTTFAEKYDFVQRKGKKTIRLLEHILNISIKVSSVSSSSLLENSGIKISKSSICNLLKKNASING